MKKISINTKKNPKQKESIFNNVKYATIFCICTYIILSLLVSNNFIKLKNIQNLVDYYKKYTVRHSQSERKDVKFKKEDLVSKLDLVTKDEFIVLKKILEKQQKELNDLKKIQKKFKKAKKS